MTIHTPPHSIAAEAEAGPSARVSWNRKVTLLTPSPLLWPFPDTYFDPPGAQRWPRLRASTGSNASDH